MLLFMHVWFAFSLFFKSEWEEDWLCCEDVFPLQVEYKLFLISLRQAFRYHVSVQKRHSPVANHYAD